MKKEKYGSTESSTKIMLMLVQKKYESRYGTRDKSKDVCNYCKEVNHWARECKKKKLTKRKKNEQNNIVEISSKGINEAFMFALFASSRSIVWYVGFNVSTRLSHEQKWFQNYETISPIKIYMGHDHNFIQKTIGKGNIRVSMSMGKNETIGIVLTNILHASSWQITCF
jgi:hypothetical protein